MFATLEITPKKYWEQLLWIGPENWGGLLPGRGEEEGVEGGREGGRDEGKGDERLDSTTTDVDIVEVVDIDGLDGGMEGRREGGREKGSDVDDDEYDIYEDQDKALGGGMDRWREGGKEGEMEEEEGNNRVNVEDENLDWLYGTGDYDDYIDNDHRTNNHDDRRHKKSSNHNKKSSSSSYSGSEHVPPPSSSSSQSQSLAPPPDPYLESHWNIASYLPAAAGEYFHFIVGEFLYQVRAILYYTIFYTIFYTM